MEQSVWTSISSKPTRRDFIRRSAAAMVGMKCENIFASSAPQAADTATLAKPGQRPYPSRVISWWSNINDLEWPAQAIRDKIQRRADQMAAAKIDVAINFGFHYRFDFAPYFGALHGYYHDVATALHERNIQFMDHFSCNVIARPRTPEDVRQFHTHERHCVNLYPDPIAARDAGYAGYRFNDLRETLIASGEPTYIQMYAGECLCHNHPDFLQDAQGLPATAVCGSSAGRNPPGRHGVLRIISPPADAAIAARSSTGCLGANCRRSPTAASGAIPPARPYDWGNYGNPAFRDWVRLRYQSNADHLKMVREVIGPGQNPDDLL